MSDRKLETKAEMTARGEAHPGDIHFHYLHNGSVMLVGLDRTTVASWIRLTRRRDILSMDLL